jgi:hypothetical protein
VPGLPAAGLGTSRNDAKMASLLLPLLLLLLELSVRSRR